MFKVHKVKGKQSMCIESICWSRVWAVGSGQPGRDKRIMSADVSWLGDPLRQNRLEMERVCFVTMLILFLYYL